MESITKNRIVLLLIDLKVKFLEKFVFSFDQFFLADAEKNGNLRSQSPELFIMYDSSGMRIIFLPQIETVFKLKDVDRVILDFIIIIVSTSHCGNEKVHNKQNHQYMERQEIRICEPASAPHSSIQLSLDMISDRETKISRS